MIPVNEPLLAGNELEYLKRCIETGWISSEGSYVKEFESKFADTVGRRFGVAVTNGTAALELALSACGFKPGDEVIMPAFTIISCAMAVVRAGAVPVLVDCDTQTWNMDINQLEAKISPRTRAIMPVHIYGLPVDMKPLVAFADQHGLSIIEDAAEAHGQTCYGKPCGSFGDMSVFSFYANKLVTTGEGGMVVTDDEALYKQLTSKRNLCFQPGKRFLHDDLGYNFRMTNLQAAVGVAQLEQLTDFLERKRRMGARYNELLAGTKGLQLPLSETDYADNCYWVYGVVLDNSVGLDAQDVMNSLAEEGIGTRPFFWPMHLQPALRQLGLFTDEQHSVAERIGRFGFYLPSGLALTDEQIEISAKALRRILT